MKRRRESHGSGRSKASLLDLHARLDDLEIQRDKILAELEQHKGNTKAEYYINKALKFCDQHIREINSALAEELTRKATLTASTRADRLRRAAEKRRRKAQRNLKLQEQPDVRA